LKSARWAGREVADDQEEIQLDGHGQRQTGIVGAADGEHHSRQPERRAPARSGTSFDSSRTDPRLLRGHTASQSISAARWRRESLFPGELDS
jgi:hypothetical protein